MEESGHREGDTSDIGVEGVGVALLKVGVVWVLKDGDAGIIDQAVESAIFLTNF